MKAPVNLAGALWVNGQAAPIVKRRIRENPNSSKRWGSIRHREKALNNFVARLRALEARRCFLCYMDIVHVFYSVNFELLFNMSRNAL